MNTISHMHMMSPQEAVRHITENAWKKANALLVKKIICELSHELLITPQMEEHLDEGWNTYALEADDKCIRYHFRAKPLSLDHLWIDQGSIKKFKEGNPSGIDAIAFIKEFRNQMGLSDQVLPTYLEEVISTLQGSAFKLEKGNPTSRDLVRADFQEIECSMTEGHPGFIANNGRIGFDSIDYRSYAPEAGNPFSIVWLAGHKSQALYSGKEALPYEVLISQELGKETIGQFRQVLTEKGRNPDDYLFIPVHPWQWFNKLAHVFSTEVATGRLVCLGYGPDEYLAQQSIRTLFNLSNPQKFYMKSALSILNMGFMRGMSYRYLDTAPTTAVWLEDLLYSDAYIQETGFRMLGEIASVSYRNPYFEEFGTHNDYNKMLASLWRESPVNLLKEGQRAMTMAAFLHIDHEGEAFLPQLIQTSGLGTDEWLRRYLKAYLSPIIHCFYQHDLVFMPHGENLIIVLEDNAPVWAFIKDITEEAAILSPDKPLPETLKRMFTQVPEDVKLLSIFIDVFDGFFRFMAHVLEEHVGYRQEDFWRLVAENISEYQGRFPALADKFGRYDIFADDFQRSCLNRLQINNNRQMIDLGDPVALLQFAGRMENPLAKYRKVHQPVSTMNE